jgi:hypothetical protein
MSFCCHFVKNINQYINWYFIFTLRLCLVRLKKHKTMIGEATSSSGGGKDDSPAAVSAKKNKKPNCM